MCAHACHFHKKKGKHVTPCCMPCSCGENIELEKIETHLATCHRVGLDVPRTPINITIPPPIRTAVPLGIRVSVLSPRGDFFVNNSACLICYLY